MSTLLKVWTYSEEVPHTATSLSPVLRGARDAGLQEQTEALSPLLRTSRSMGAQLQAFFTEEKRRYVQAAPASDLSEDEKTTTHPEMSTQTKLQERRETSVQTSILQECKEASVQTRTPPRWTAGTQTRRTSRREAQCQTR